jgi:hypothetical protein
VGHFGTKTKLLLRYDELFLFAASSTANGGQALVDELPRTVLTSVTQLLISH